MPQALRLEAAACGNAHHVVRLGDRREGACSSWPEARAAVCGPAVSSVPPIPAQLAPRRAPADVNTMRRTRGVEEVRALQVLAALDAVAEHAVRVDLDADVLEPAGRPRRSGSQCARRGTSPEPSRSRCAPPEPHAGGARDRSRKRRASGRPAPAARRAQPSRSGRWQDGGAAPMRGAETVMRISCGRRRWASL